VVIVRQVLRIAVPSKGRLREPAIQLIHDAGLGPETPSDRALAFPCRNAPVEALLVRADDVPEYVQDGVVDCGITGLDIVRERGADVRELARLGFGACSLEVAVPAFVETLTLPLLFGLAPTRAKSTVSEPIVTSPAGAPPMLTPVMPPSFTKPVPLIVMIVPGQLPAAVTTCGTEALPPTQLVIVTAPAEPAATSPTATSSEMLSARRLGDIRDKALSLTSRASLLKKLACQGPFGNPENEVLPRARACCN